MKRYIVFLACAVYFFGCGGKAKHKEEFVGIWESNDSATLSLQTDGVVIVDDLDISKIFDGHSDGLKVSMKGQWAFSHDRDNNDVIEILVGKYSFDFLIGGEGLFENRPPWNLYTFIGDPDEMNRYVFRKK